MKGTCAMGTDVASGIYTSHSRRLARDFVPTSTRGLTGLHQLPPRKCHHRPFVSVRRAGHRCSVLVCRAASEACASVSKIISQEIILFCFQQDLDSALQRALNTDNLERAQELRQRLQMIDEAVEEIQVVKQSGGEPGEEPDAGLNLSSTISKSVRLRANLQEAIIAEQYEEAARLRDELKEVQERLNKASGSAEAASQLLKEQRQLRLGQRVIHRDLGYRAVVCGWDASCSESKDWQQQTGICQLQGGPGQPFYQLLVDVRDCDGEEWQETGPIAYAAQEQLCTPEPQKCWVEEFGDQPLSNPFVSNLFLGFDERGDLIPTRALREKFCQGRRDVDPPDSMRDTDDESPDDEPPDDESPDDSSSS